MGFALVGRTEVGQQYQKAKRYIGLEKHRWAVVLIHLLFFNFTFVWAAEANIQPTQSPNVSSKFFSSSQMTNLKHLYFLTLVLLVINPTYLISQKLVATDTLSSSYKNLPTLKNYGISFSSMVSGDSSWFKIGDNKVDEKTYKKFTKYSDNIDKCRPCILLSYDTSENLRLKRITYGDCCVGYWIEYFANGQVKVIGHFKENTTGKWDNIFEKGYCREDGVWTYFNNNGKQLYSEIWKEGKLIKKIKSKTN